MSSLSTFRCEAAGAPAAIGRTLIVSVWDELVGTVTPVTDIRPIGCHARFVIYEQVERFPDGLLPIGDSVCSFDPTHGQGMSSAAGQVRGLQPLLAGRAADGRGLNGSAMEFFPIAQEWVRGPWILAAVTLRTLTAPVTSPTPISPI